MHYVTKSHKIFTPRMFLQICFEFRDLAVWHNAFSRFEGTQVEIVGGQVKAQA